MSSSRRAVSASKSTIRWASRHRLYIFTTLFPFRTNRFRSPVRDNTRKTRRPYFLFVGRLEKIKGLQTIIPFFRRYSKAELWIVGKGKYEPRLKRLTGGNNNIRFLGYRQGQALHSLYQGAIAVIVPSLCLEIASSVIPEAFMHRTPVIARRLAGMQEISRRERRRVPFRHRRGIQACSEQPGGRPLMPKRARGRWLSSLSPGLDRGGSFETVFRAHRRRGRQDRKGKSLSLTGGLC